MIKTCVALIHILTIVHMGAFSGLVLCRHPSSQGIHMEAHHSTCPSDQDGQTAFSSGVNGNEELERAKSPCDDIALEYQAVTTLGGRNLRIDLSRSSPSVAVGIMKVHQSYGPNLRVLRGVRLHHTALTSLSSTILLI
jgi:hypothetical protein